MRRARPCLRGSSLWIVLAVAAVAAPPELRTPTAITDATLVTAPGEQVERATVLLRDGRIAAVGAALELPPGCETIDGTGLFVYAGFVDGLTRLGVHEPKTSEMDERRREGRFVNISDEPVVRMPEASRYGLYPSRRAADLLDVNADTYQKLRAAGFAAALVAPPEQLLGGHACVLRLDGGPVRDGVVAADVVQTASFQTPRGRVLLTRSRYPATPLGVFAHLRQAFYDARWQADLAAYAQRTGQRPADLRDDPDLAALRPVLAGEQRVAWSADDADEINRVLALAEEFSFKPIIVGGREAYKCLDQLKAHDAAVLVSLKLPAEVRKDELNTKKLSATPDDDTLLGKAWEDRPFAPAAAYAARRAQRERELANAAQLEHAGVTWAFATDGLKDPKDAVASINAMVKAGLPADAALRALTTAPAKLFNVHHDLGTLAPSKRACLTVLTAPLGDEHAQVRYVFVDGQKYTFPVKHSAKDKRQDGARDDQRASQDDTNADDDPPAEEVDAELAAEASADVAPASRPATQPTNESATSQPADFAAQIRTHRAEFPAETEATRKPPTQTSGDLLLRNATVLTITQGDLANASILVRDGRIAAIGQELDAPAGVTVIDCTGYVVMPGIVDPHSHIALDAVNEWSNSVTCETRCGDVVRSDTRRIYDALTGGTTTIHAMHGSANTIGGQNVLLKLKYGQPARDLIIPGAHRTVKWALGENVKRGGMRSSRRGGDSPLRFPGTRMGVEGTLRRALYAGREYARQWVEYEQAIADGKDLPPPRRDVRLEALADILAGNIWVQTHCYRADEILRLIAVAEEFGIRIAGLHHVLEAYRIMPEIARHGAGTATFSDWWAYKIEAYDAVPQNAGMLLQAGINSAIKSDSADLMRHLNLEAAKCLKYSGIAPNDALRLITLNAARLFGLDERLGSIEVGKDADFAIFDGHPLDTFSRCVATIIEGEIYFLHPDFSIERHTPARRPLMDFAGAVAVAPDPAAGPPAEDLPSDAEVYAIVGGTVHPVSGPPTSDGVVLIHHGKIAAVGARDQVNIPQDAVIVHAAGQHVYPGLINPGTELGLYEIGAVDVTVDTAEPGTAQPDLLAVSAVNPHSAMIEIARAEGVLTALIVPASPRIAGQAGLIDLSGWTMDEMLRDPRAALVVGLPSKASTGLTKSSDESRRGGGENDELQELYEFFVAARRYAAARRYSEQHGTRFTLDPDPRFDALVPYVLGEKPVIFYANSYKPILEALLFAAALELKPILYGGRDAWMLADVLVEREIPVLYTGVFDMPGEYDAWDANYTAAAKMAAAGVKFAFAHRDADLCKLLPIEAGWAVAHGLDEDAALRACTLSAADILGVAGELGSLDKGKVANVLVTSGHPCQATTRVVHAFVRGRPVPLGSKHTRAAKKFANRPPPALPPARTDLKGPPSLTRPSKP